MSNVDSNSDIDPDDYLSISSSDTSFNSFPSLAESLSCQFSDTHRNMNVVHINAQSIPAHFPDMLATFDCSNIHAILVSESWLKPCLNSISYDLPGFRLVRNDRALGGGGGVAIYLREYIPYSILSMSPQPPPSDAGEHLFLEVVLNHTKILLGVYYCPSLRINFFDSLENILEQFLPSYNHTIIMGDFNTCLLKDDFRACSLRSLVGSKNLSILPLNATHHFPNCIPSLLDLIFVSCTEHVAKHGQYTADAFSYHDLLFLSYKIQPPKPKTKILMQRNFRTMDANALLEDAKNLDWNPLVNSTNVDEQVQIFNNIITNLYDKHAPIRAIKIKHRPSPWLTDEIKMLLAKKAKAKSRYRCRKSTLDWEKYVEIRNHCNKVCRNAQRRHIHSSIENGDPVKIWKFLRSLGLGKSRLNTLPSDLNIDALNDYFSSTPKFDDNIKASTVRFLSSLPKPDCSPFVLNQVTVSDVKKSIISITSNAVGSDCVSRNMILPILDQILPTICHILNTSIETGDFPTVWKEAQLTPLPKKNNPTSFSEFRPISILPFLSKVLERLVHYQLSAYLTKNDLLNPFQSGFRPGHSTSTALVHITDDIRLGMEYGKVTVLALLDFSNAFNTVDFDVMLSILCSLNVSPDAIDWFHSYLCGRRQRIHIEGQCSSWCNITAGVPQGGVLSPLLFAIFINTISNGLSSSFHLYADDLQIYTQAPVDGLTAAIDSINRDLCHICDWSKAHGLAINPTKTQVLVVGGPRMNAKFQLSQLPQVFCDGSVIEYNDQVKNLGIIIDRNLSWNPQLQELSRKVYAAAGSLRRLRNFLPIPTKISLVQSLLFPILDYADASYLDLTENQLNKLERLQNFFIRFIFGLRKYDHVSEFRTKLKWLTVRLRRNTHILSLLFAILFSPSSPSYLKDRFGFLYESHSRLLRSSENLKLSTPIHTTRYMDQSFAVQAVRLWNALPLTIRQAKTSHSFKLLVKEHYLNSLQ